MTFLSFHVLILEHRDWSRYFWFAERSHKHRNYYCAGLMFITSVIKYFANMWCGSKGASDSQALQFVPGSETVTLL